MARGLHKIMKLPEMTYSRFKTRPHLKKRYFSKSRYPYMCLHGFRNTDFSIPEWPLSVFLSVYFTIFKFVDINKPNKKQTNKTNKQNKTKTKNKKVNPQHAYRVNRQSNMHNDSCHLIGIYLLHDPQREGSLYITTFILLMV